MVFDLLISIAICLYLFIILLLNGFYTVGSYKVIFWVRSDRRDEVRLRKNHIAE